MVFPFPGYTQDTVKSHGQTQIVGGDTLSVIELYPVVIFPEVKFDNRRQANRYDKLVYNIRKVYPYAKLAGEKLKYYKSVLDTIPTEKARKKYLKKAEKELEAQFGDQLRDLTFSQGKLLIKLIYRETGNSTYDIVRELRGKFSAFIYQTLARLFGYDLRTSYDPVGDDLVIEQIVQMIESETP
jgi:hypothetical protein